MSTAVYRFEMSPNNRAGCQNSKCKHEGVKIMKGEFRFGTQVFIQEHYSWQWKHWGCVTPVQIANLQSQVGPLDDLDLDSDLPAILDGYDELSVEAQEKVKEALVHGHVADEDWKGEPELNRPGMKGINKRTPKKKKKAPDSEVDGEAGAAGDDQSPSKKPKAKKSRAKKVKAESAEDGEDVPAPKKAGGRKRKAPAEDDLDEPEPAPVEKPKKSRAKKVKAEEQDSLDSDIPLNAPAKPVKKPARSKKVKKEELPEDDEVTVAPKAKTAKPKAKKVKAEEEDDANEPLPHDDADDAPEPPKKKKKKGRTSRTKK